MLVGVQESLEFRLLGTAGELGSWGHEYVRYVYGQGGCIQVAGRHRYANTLE